MIATLEPYNIALKSLKQDLPKILRQILLDNEVEIIRILNDEQLGKGLNSDDEVVGTYSRATEIESLYGNFKPRKPKEEDKPYNFEWTGGLKDGMTMGFEDFYSYSLFSLDEKAKFLEQEYGDIFTLTTKNNERINQEILRPQMFEIMIQRLYV